jgi:hypothetical protein
MKVFGELASRLVNPAVSRSCLASEVIDGRGTVTRAANPKKRVGLEGVPDADEKALIYLMIPDTSTQVSAGTGTRIKGEHAVVRAKVEIATGRRALKLHSRSDPTGSPECGTTNRRQRLRIPDGRSMKKFSLLLWIVACWFVAQARAVDINGTVTGAQGDTVQITTQSEVLPNVGDKVTVFFKIPGTDDEILVGSGSVTAIKGEVIGAKLEKATGQPQQGQLARITSDKPQAKLHYAPASPGSEAPPAPPHYANDDAHLLKAETLAQLNARLAAYERQTSNQFVLAIFEQLPPATDEETFATDVFRAWKPGQAGLDNGAILFVFVRDHKIWIQPGTGLKKALTVEVEKHITRDVMAPAFKAGDFDGGVLAGMQALMDAAKDAYPANGRTRAERSTSPD